jgi:hypothetical protein
MTVLSVGVASGVNERQLFHGTPATNINAITSEGFNCHPATATSNRRGTALAESSSVAAGYSYLGVFPQAAGAAAAARAGAFGQARSARVGKMLLVKVVLGQQQPTCSVLNPWDAAWDSMYSGGQMGPTGCAYGASTHAIFDSHQAYPAYVVSI